MTFEEVYEQWDEFLDETNDPIEIAGIRFAPSYVLRTLDPITYRVYASDYFDAEGIDEEVNTGCEKC